jgi:hypothetical protein
MSIPPRIGLQSSPPGLDAAWLRANVDAAAVSFVLGLVTYAIRQALGMPDPNADLLAKATMGVAETLASAVTFAVYASRTGAVLAQRLPAFPPLTWNALHILAGIAVGVGVALLNVNAAPAPYEPPALGLVIGMTTGGMLAGAVLGGLLGVGQALVLRNAARDIRPWIRWSVISGTAFGLFSLALYINSDQSLASESLLLALSFIIAVVSGVLMLPAVDRIEPPARRT